MIITNARLITTAVEKNGYPDTTAPEIAFVGRSNVGKSSLINALAGRKALARKSAAPGKTRVINFFGMDDAVIFVDLPGYGYAKASKKEIVSWGRMAEGYLKSRKQLKAIVFLLDIRRAPTGDDLKMYEWLTFYGYKIITVATKSDKLNQREAAASLKSIKDALGVSATAFSSVKKTGKDELWEAINLIIRQASR